jgi:hypothetical protein
MPDLVSAAVARSGVGTKSQVAETHRSICSDTSTTQTGLDSDLRC